MLIYSLTLTLLLSCPPVLLLLSSRLLLPFCPSVLLLSCLLFYYEAENKVKIKVRGLKYSYYKYKLRLIIKKIYKIYKINIKININLRLI